MSQVYPKSYVLSPPSNNLLFLLSLVIYKAVANAALRKNIFRIGRILFQFLAQIINIETYIMRLIAIFVSPYFDQQLIMRHNPTCILYKMIKQTVFSGAQFDKFALQPDLAPIEINLEAVIHFDNIMHRAAGTLCSTNDSFYAAD